MSLKPYTIVLADDHVMFRQGMKDFSEKKEGLRVSGEANNGQELLDHLQGATPDLIILDIAMPRLRGLEALHEIKNRFPQVKVLILSMYGNQEFIRQAVAEGAAGFILKESSRSEVVRAIEAIRQGTTYFSPKLSETLKNIIMEKADNNCLTWREKEVIKYLAWGWSTQQVADELFVSKHTVRRHRQNILHKLNLKSTTELVRYAISEGLAG
jgi:DNA-binding NarL/FixJ family response regulator